MALQEIKYNAKKRTVTGTNENDLINAGECGYVAPETGKYKNVGLKITGGKGDDTITGTNYNDKIYGGAGSDSIIGSLGSDNLSGGAGENVIVYDNLDKLEGDKIYLTKGENALIDVSAIENATATYKLAGKNLVVSVKSGEEGEAKEFTIINFGTKDVTNNATKKKADTSSVELKLSNTKTVDLRTEAIVTVNSKTGTFHNDIIKMDGYNLYTDKKKQNIDMVHFNKKGLSIKGLAGNDSITATRYSDTVKGGNGNDAIISGTGNDKIYGEAGKNTLIFNKGDGNDIVYSGKGEDTIKFGNSVEVDDINIVRSGKYDLKIGYNHNGEGVAQDSILIKNYYNKKGAIVSSVKNISVKGNTFALETFRQAKDYNVITSNGTIDGTEGNDFIVATSVADTASQLIYGKAGDDIIVSSDNAPMSIHADDGDDEIYVSKNKFTSIYTGAGNDTIHAEDLSNVQELWNNYAHYYTLESGNNTVIFGKRQTIKHDVVVSASGGNDTIYLPTEDADKYKNRYYLTSSNKDCGHDTFIYQNGYSNGIADWISLEKYSKSETFFTREEGSDDLVLRCDKNNDVTFKDYFKKGNENFAKALKISFNDTPASIVLEDLVAQKGVGKIKNGESTTITGTDDNDYIIAKDTTETINAKGGNDAIVPNGGNDTISLGAGNDIVFAGAGNKVINANSGDNFIRLGSGNNKVKLGTGSDTIHSGSGQNTLELTTGDTVSDTYYYSGGNDTIHFKADNLTALSADLTGNDAIISKGNSATITIKDLEDINTGVTIKDKNNATSTIFNLNTKLGNSTVTGGKQLVTGSGNDTIFSGLGNDSITSGTGTNTIYLTLADEQNLNVYNYTQGAVDTFVMPETIEDTSNFYLQKSNNDLIFAYNNDLSNNTLVFKDYCLNADTIKSNVKFNVNGSVMTLAQIINDIHVTLPVVGTEGDDEHLGNEESDDNQYITALAGNDTVYGGNGNDYLYGGSGNDVMRAGSGDDTYVIEADDWGNEKDIISDTAGNDTLKIDTSKANIHAYFEVNMVKNGGNYVYNDDDTPKFTYGNDLYINSTTDYDFATATTTNGVKIVNHFTTGQIENIQALVNSSYVDAFDERYIPATGQAIANWLALNGFDSTAQVISEGTNEQKEHLLKFYKPTVSSLQTVHGTNDDDIIIGTYEHGGNFQSIYAEYGNDVLFASETSASRLSGSNGNDTFYVSKTKFNEIYTGEGNDIIHAEDMSNVEHRATYYASYYHLEGGNNTVYLGLRPTVEGLMVVSNRGNDTIYLPTNDATQYKNEYWLTDDYRDFGHDTFIYQNGYTNGVADKLVLHLISKKDLVLTRTGESDDLVLRYAEDNDITFKDYYKAGYENFKKAMKIETIETMQNSSDPTIEAFVEQKGVKKYVEGMGTINGTVDSDYIKGSASADTIQTKGGDDYVVAGAGNDTIYIKGAGGHTIVNGGSGSDAFSSGFATPDTTTVEIYTNSSYGGKDINPGAIEGVDIHNLTTNGNKIYAQSAINDITGGKGDDLYFAYCDQKTTITDESGYDSLTFLNSEEESNDGNKSNLHILFNVSSDYNYDDSEATLFSGNVILTDTNNATKANYDLWKADGGYKGVSITANSVEQIKSSDNYTLTKENISNLAESVAGWLTTKGYASVDGVFSNALGKADNNSADITALVAKFDEANWTI